VRRLSLFGSALREDFDAGRSDLDFAVEFSPMSPREHAASYFGLLEDLENIFGRRVDLVEVEAVRNPYLRREIEEQQEIFYAAA
jgi:predicted nucleotidyltransferase